MSKLTAKARKKLPKSEFGLPGSKKYPINDKAHAANAKARAQQQYDKGNISKSELEKIDRKANTMLDRGKKKKRNRKMGLLAQNGIITSMENY